MPIDFAIVWVLVIQQFLGEIISLLGIGFALPGAEPNIDTEPRNPELLEASPKDKLKCKKEWSANKPYTYQQN